MLAYCVYRSTSLKARLPSEQFGGKEGGVIRPTANFLASDLAAECNHERRMNVLIEVNFKKLNSTAFWASVLFYSLVTVSLAVS